MIEEITITHEKKDLTPEIIGLSLGLDLTWIRRLAVTFVVYMVIGNVNVLRGKKMTQGSSDSANTVSERKQPLVLTFSTHDSKQEWVLDSCFSFHITPQREVLFD